MSTNVEFQILRDYDTKPVPPKSQEKEFLSLTAELIKTSLPRPFHYSHEWQYSVETGTNIPSALEVWRRDDKHREKKPTIIRTIPEPYKSNLTAIIQFMRSTAEQPPKPLPASHDYLTPMMEEQIGIRDPQA